MKAVFSSHASSKCRGYTMVELIVATGLMGIVMVSMVGTFMVFASGSKGVAAYTEMSQQSRKALELFARDIRASEDVTTATQHDVVVVIPEDTYYSGGTAQYTFDQDLGLFSRVIRDNSGVVTSNQILLDGVELFAFGYFDPLGQSLDYAKESLLLSVKSIQIDAEMVRAVSQNEATDYIISARFLMRNRPVTE